MTCDVSNSRLGSAYQLPTISVSTQKSMQLSRHISTLDETEIEADAKEKAKEKAIKDATKKGKDAAEIADAAAQAEETAVADPKAQRNFTDPESRMMKTNDGYHYAYNGQAVVDEKSQVIIAAEITQAASDVNQLMPMISSAKENLESIGIDDAARVVLLDAGYCSTENLAEIAKTRTNALIATGRLKHNERVPDAPRGRIPNDATDKERMARRLRTKQGRKDYARRKSIPIDSRFSLVEAIIGMSWFTSLAAWVISAAMITWESSSTTAWPL